MIENEVVSLCLECGKYFHRHAMYVGDQSLCPKCRAEREYAIQKNRNLMTNIDPENM